MRSILTNLLLIICFIAYSNDTTVIFNKNREYVYKALFIDTNNDTVTNEIIRLKPTGENWKIQPAQKEYNLFFTPSTNAVNITNPVNKRQKKVDRYRAKAKKKGNIFNGIWLLKATSGAYESNTEIWLHPIRQNQYVYTQIAPFPEIRLKKLKEGEQWNSSLNIMAGWDNFKGTVNSTYNVIKKVTYSNEGIYLNECWQIHSIGHHSTLGESTNDFIFSLNYGFVRMHYKAYNGVKIHFDLIKIVDLK